MTTTPTIWKSAFTANSGATTGLQQRGQGIALANGKFLVMWEDDTTGPARGSDIMGQMFDSTGNPLGGLKQINSAYVGSNETEPKAIGLPDGGFVVAYGSYLEQFGGFIVVERFDSSGNSIANNLILDDNNSLTKWEITSDTAGNYTVAFERSQFGEDDAGNTGLQKDIRAIRYDAATNAAGTEYDAAKNSGDYDLLAGLATRANGDAVTIYTEPDIYRAPLNYSWAQTVEFRIANPSAVDFGNVAGKAAWLFYSDEVQAFAADIAVLAGGQMVLLYGVEAGASYQLAMRIASGEVSDLTLAPEIHVRAFSGMVNPQVVALRDGGFVVAWADITASAILGTRYNASGNAIGVQGFIIAEGIGSTGTTILNSMSLFVDGRVLVTFRDAAGEISTAILDPREKTIVGTDASEALTARLESSAVYGEGGNDALYGQAGNDFLKGGIGNDAIDGGSGNDTLNGDQGADTLNGGTGDDTYILDTLFLVRNGRQLTNAYDVVKEDPAQGIDTVKVGKLADVPKALTGYTLTAEVENGVIVGTDAFNLNGNAIDNRLTGNSAANVMSGLDGNDTLDGGSGGADRFIGGRGDDTYVVNSVSDQVIELANEGTDTVLSRVSFRLTGGQAENITLVGKSAMNATGNSLSNHLKGTSGSNILDGGKGGADTLEGGAGADTYIVNNAGDRVLEANGAGADTVKASASFSLSGQEIEILILTGSTAINGTGNTLANTMTGNTAANILNGGSGADQMSGKLGNDTYVVDNASDRVFEADNQGSDTVNASVSFSLSSQAIERLTLTGISGVNGTGNELDNTIIGNSGANTLNGAAGADFLRGLGGADLYHVDNSGDVVDEAFTGSSGVDTIQGSVSIDLGDTARFKGAIERVLLNQNLSGLNSTGNTLSNIIAGNAFGNTINGKGGNDMLTGGLGTDKFVFDTALAGNIDRITDFSVPDDTVQLDNAIFKLLGANGTLTASMFKNTANGAIDANDRIIYNHVNGVLTYDTNGSSSGASTQFATLTTGLALTNSDFVII